MRKAPGGTTVISGQSAQSVKMEPGSPGSGCPEPAAGANATATKEKRKRTFKIACTFTTQSSAP